MTTTQTTPDAEWSRSEAAVARSLGFKVIRQDGGPEPDRFQLQIMDFKPNGEMFIHAVRPVEKPSYDAFQEAVRYRRDHDQACKFSWELYEAATGQDFQTFRGVGPGGPVEEVRRAVARSTYPRAEGDHTVIGPGAILSADLATISYKGELYQRLDGSPDAVVAVND